MIKLDDDLLKELGLVNLPAEEKKKLLAHIYETLEMRVGMKLAEQMSDAQLTEFEQFIDRNDEAGALRWLEGNFPNYKDVVAAEFENLKTEIAHVAPQILSSSVPQGVVPQQPPMGMGPQQHQPAPAYPQQHPQQPPQQQWPAGHPQQPQPQHPGPGYDQWGQPQQHPQQQPLQQPQVPQHGYNAAWEQAQNPQQPLQSPPPQAPPPQQPQQQ